MTTSSTSQRRPWNLHFALGCVLGSRDVEGIKVDVIALNALDDEHL